MQKKKNKNNSWKKNISLLHHPRMSWKSKFQQNGSRATVKAVILKAVEFTTGLERRKTPSVAVLKL